VGNFCHFLEVCGKMIFCLWEAFGGPGSRLGNVTLVGWPMGLPLRDIGAKSG
jgi:hypothetical protein